MGLFGPPRPKKEIGKKGPIPIQTILKHGQITYTIGPPCGPIVRANIGQYGPHLPVQ